MNQDLFNRVHTHLEQQDDILLSGLSGSARAFSYMKSFVPGAASSIWLLMKKAYDLSYALKKLLGRTAFFTFLRDFVFMKENIDCGGRAHRKPAAYAASPRRTAVYITTPVECFIISFHPRI